MTAAQPLTHEATLEATPLRQLAIDADGSIRFARIGEVSRGEWAEERAASRTGCLRSGSTTRTRARAERRANARAAVLAYVRL